MAISSTTFDRLIEALHILSTSTAESPVVDQESGEITAYTHTYFGKRNKKTRTSRKLAEVKYNIDCTKVIAFNIFPVAISKELVRPRMLIGGTYGTIKLLASTVRQIISGTHHATTATNRALDAKGVSIQVRDSEAESESEKGITWHNVPA